MTSEHLRPLLDDWSSMQVLVKAAEMFAWTEIPESVVQIVKMGRLTALSKPDGGVPCGGHNGEAVGPSCDEGDVSPSACSLHPSRMRMHRPRATGPYRDGPSSHCHVN